MKKLELQSQFWVLFLMSFLAFFLPLSIKLINQHQDNRSQATEGSTSKISFKIAFIGIKPKYTDTQHDNYNCLSSLKNIKIEVANKPTNTFQSNINAPLTPVSGETNKNGDQVFLVSNLILDSKFNNLTTFNYLRVKGPFHLSSRICLDNQSSKLDELTTCDINFSDTNNTVYNFSNYPLVPGDIDQDGTINTRDFSIIKSNLSASADITCSKIGDLNLDGVVNSLDISLFKNSLASREGDSEISNTPSPTKTPTQTPTPTPSPTKTPTPTPTTPNVKYTTFDLTFYTSLPVENGGYTSMACGGKIANVKEIIYVANNVYPCGTQIYLEGYGVMTVKDRGGKSFDSKTRLDVLIPRNQGESDNNYFKRVNNKGRQKAKGYIVK